MLKFLINLFKKKNRTQRYFKKYLTYTYKDEDNNVITKTINDVEIILRETAYGHSCNVICAHELKKEEIMAIIRMFL